jgi:Raf kinase inhibitor-like YbhB/YbcL family protein
MLSMQITSTEFQDNETMPAECSAFKDNTHPSLTFSEIPEGTVSLALILKDPDAVSGTYYHWLIANMSPATLQIVMNDKPITGEYCPNSHGEADYFGPKPPEGTGSHRYQFYLYALDDKIDDPQKLSPEELEAEAQDKAIDSALLTDMFSFEDGR